VLLLVGFGAALLLAIGFVLQQHEAAEVPPGKPGPRLLLALVRRPIWLGGIAAMICGQLLGATALGMGSLVVVEPLLATNVLFALSLAALTSRRRLSRGDWIGAVLLVGGLAVFLFGISPSATVDTHGVGPGTWAVAGGIILLVVLVLLLIGRRRTPRTHAALTATAAGILFGLQDFLTQRSIVRLEDGVLALVASWYPWVLLVVAVTGLALAQRGFSLADLSASLPPITLAEPVVGIALSIGTLGRGLPHRPLPLACVVGGLALMLTGVVVLTRSPLVVDPHGRRRHLHAAHGAHSAAGRR
jgi:drug/metabolite transporter (DMT)-like permease